MLRLGGVWCDVACVWLVTTEGGLDDDGAGAVHAPVHVAASLPVGEILEVELAASRAEALEDDAVGEALVEHLVDGFAGFAGEAGDFAVAGSG